MSLISEWLDSPIRVNVSAECFEFEGPTGTTSDAPIVRLAEDRRFVAIGEEAVLESETGTLVRLFDEDRISQIDEKALTAFLQYQLLQVKALLPLRKPRIQVSGIERLEARLGPAIREFLMRAFVAAGAREVEFTHTN